MINRSEAHLVRALSGLDSNAGLQPVQHRRFEVRVTLISIMRMCMVMIYILNYIIVQDMHAHNLLTEEQNRVVDEVIHNRFTIVKVTIVNKYCN